MIKKELKNYLQTKILPFYEQNTWEYQKWHVYQTIEKSLKLAKNNSLSLDMVYTIAIYHDIIPNNEKKSAEILWQDEFLKKFFTEEERKIMYEAILEEHKYLTKERKTIYGKIIADAECFSNILELIRSIQLHHLEFKKDISLEKMFEKTYSKIKTLYLKNEKITEDCSKEIEYYLNHIPELKKEFYKIDTYIRKERNIPLEKFHYTKRYYSIDEYWKKHYNQKVYKISLNAGFSCPNIKNGHGCIFCSNQSGDFAGNKEESLPVQFQKIKNKMQKKWPNGKYIAYFQAGTNTYAPLPILKEKYESVLNQEDVIGLDIATRSDAISKETLDYLEELNKKTNLTIELGLQSIHNKTLKWINRGHTKENFEKMVLELHRRKIKIVVHIINGLPNETKKEMIETIKYLNTLPIFGIKIHMLHILKDTPLASTYQKQPFHLLTKEEYIDIVCTQIEYLRPDIVIHRLTGDPKKEDLIAPSWLLKKFVLLNDIDKELIKRNTYQGKRVCK